MNAIRRIFLIGKLKYYSTAPKPKKTLEGLSERPDPHSVSRDYIGPPDEKSNLRPYVRAIAPNETPLATELRELQIKVEAWNHEFWTKHNKRFIDEKQDFIRLHKLAGNNELSADKMSEFYKSFLDKNKKIHLLYNVSWYLKNYNLLILTLLVKIQKLFSKNKKP